MKILLIDVDSKRKNPNLAIMKISAFYKSIGHETTLVRLFYSGFPGIRKSTHIDTTKYLKVFASVLYEYNKNVLTFTDTSKVDFGGTGYDARISLHDRIASMPPDYSIYTENTKSHGFITRGCLRNCPFCVVPSKEGKTYIENTIDKIQKHKEVCLMDNNILSHKDHLEILRDLAERQIRVHFNSGLDIRLVTHENAKILASLNYFGDYLFSFDRPKDLSRVDKGAKIILKIFPKSRHRRIKFCILVGYNTTLCQDVERVEWCRANGVLPYIMRYKDCWDCDNKDFYTDLAGYCNMPQFFKKINFRAFLIRRHTKKTMTNHARILRSSAIYEAAA